MERKEWEAGSQTRKLRSSEAMDSQFCILPTLKVPHPTPTPGQTTSPTWDPVIKYVSLCRTFLTQTTTHTCRLICKCVSGKVWAEKILSGRRQHHPQAGLQT